MAGYSKDFLIDVYMHKFITSKLVDINTLVILEDNANKFFDRVGRDEFRKYADVTPERIKEYRTSGV